MSLMHLDPFTEMDGMFARLMPSGFARSPRLSIAGNVRKDLQWLPTTDISETDQEYLIRAELPAVDKEDFRVTVDSGTITIKGERKQQQDDKTEKYHRVETFYGCFERSFGLPDNANADAIRCVSKDGILTVHIPKREAQQSKPRRISVQ